MVPPAAAAIVVAVVVRVVVAVVVDQRAANRDDSDVALHREVVRDVRSVRRRGSSRVVEHPSHHGVVEVHGHRQRVVGASPEGLGKNEFARIGHIGLSVQY